MHVLLHLAFPTVEATLDKQIKFFNIKVIFSNTVVVNDINVQSRVMHALLINSLVKLNFLAKKL